jgi:hypothetical protein
MKTLVVFLSLTFFLIAGSGLSLAAAEAPKTNKPVNAVVNYNPKYKCVMVCRSEKPALEVLEDGLAYALDVPLALLSPITCPIVTPLMDRLDSDPDRYYDGRRFKR